MTEPLIKRLRGAQFIDHADAWNLCDEAADRIEELEAALQIIWDAYPFREKEDAELGEIVISALEKRDGNS